MLPFDALTEEDVAVISKYITAYSSCEVDDLRRILRVWDEAKEDYLFSDMFNGNLRMTVPVECENIQMLVNEMVFDKFKPITVSRWYSPERIPGINIEHLKDVLYLNERSGDTHKFIVSFLKHMIDLFYDGAVGDGDIMVLSKLFSTQNLSTNKISENVFSEKVTFKFNDRRVDIVPGAKTISTIGKVVDVFGYPHTELFKRFCNDVTTVVSYKSLTNKDLVLSIHPIDYLTASDNNCGWTSCYNWNDGSSSDACVELMNSSNTIVAYFENTKDEFSFDGHRIPNKSFRVFVTIDKNMLLVGKSYPYGCSELSKAILNAVEKVVPFNYDRHCENYVIWDEREKNDDAIKVVMSQNAYNDFENDDNTEFFCSRNTVSGKYNNVYVCGPLICMSCGGVTSLVNGQKYCHECMKRKKCSVCGYLHNIDELAHNIDVVRIFPHLKSVNHSIQNIGKQCLAMDFVPIGMNMYIDKTEQKCYNNSIDYNKWTHHYNC